MTTKIQKTTITTTAVHSTVILDKWVDGCPTSSGCLYAIIKCARQSLKTLFDSYTRMDRLSD